MRQNAEKLRRENNAAEPFARAARDNDFGSLRYYGALGGHNGGDVSHWNLLGRSAAAHGNLDDPELGAAMMGAGHPMASTAEGQNRTLNASRFTPVMGEDRYGNKQPAGAFNTRTGGYQPFGQPADVGGAPMQPPAQPGFNRPAAPVNPNAPQVGYQPAAAYNPPATQPTGGDYLQTLPPGQASLIVGILDGRTPPPTGNALLAPRNQRLLEDLALVEPGFDMTKWVERYKTAQDFSSGGKSGQAVKSANQAITHLGRLTENADTLHNSENLGQGIPVIGGLVGMATQPYNAAKNAVANTSGEVGTGPFDLSRKAFADEIAKVFRTTGMSDHEIEQWHNTINSSQSPTQLRANIGEALRLYHGAVDALEQNRTRGMGTFRPQPPLLDPSTVETMKRIEGWTKGSKWQSAPAAPAGPQPATALPPGPTGHPPSINDTAPLPGPGARSSFDDRFSAAGEPPALAQAREAIAKGAPRAAVIQRLHQMGVDPGGL